MSITIPISRYDGLQERIKQLKKDNKELKARYELIDKKVAASSSVGKQCKCAYCDYTGGGESYKINRHQDTCKHNPKNIEKLSTQTATEYRCPYCEYKSPYNYHVRRHMSKCKHANGQTGAATVDTTVGVMTGASTVDTPTVAPEPVLSNLEKLTNTLAEPFQSKIDKLSEENKRLHEENELLRTTLAQVLTSNSKAQ